MSTISDLVEQLEQLDRTATSPGAQLDQVIECLFLPIEWMNKEPAHEALVHHSAWKQHVWHIFKEIIPQWTFALNSSAQRYLLQNTLYLSSLANSTQVTMARSSLPILLECLLASNQQEVSLETLEIYSNSLKSLLKLIPLYGEYIAIQDVRFFCSLICSIPGHLGNAFGIQNIQYTSDHEWYTDRKFYAVTSQLCANNLTEKSVLFTQELLGKIVRQGYEDLVMEAIYTSSSKSGQYWAAVCEQMKVIASPEQIIRPILYYAKQTVLSKTNSSIFSASKRIAHLLFGDLALHVKPQERQERICEFLNIAMFRLVKSSWADDILARLVITIAILAEGGEQEEGQLTESAQSLIKTFAKRAIKAWADPVFLKHASSREKYYMTAIVLTLVAYLSVQDVQMSLMAETGLLNSVSQYFDSGDMATAQIGAVMAEAISSKIDRENPLNTTLLDSQDRLCQLKGLVFVTDALDKDDLAGISSEEESNNKPEQEQLGFDQPDDELDPDEAFDLDSQASDADSEQQDEEYQAYMMEDESDDEGLKAEESSKKQHKKPVFIRDLIGCLQDQNDPLKLEIGLNAAEQVIRLKAGAGIELSESSIELARYIIAFPESYEIENFQTLQRNALVALMTAVPRTVCGFIIDEIYNRDSSDGQKQLILGSISLAVRELAGWSPTKEEPALSDNNNISRSTQIGTPLFVSKKMSLQQPKRIANKLSGLAGSVFFFPLLVGWWEGTQGLIKYWIGNNALLTERFIMTLNIIMHSATNTPDKRKIVKEYFQFVSSMKYASISTHTVSIRKAMLLGIDTILSTCYAGQELLLYQDYQKELYETKQWLEDLVEQADEPQLQDLTIGIIVKLSQIALTATNSLVTQN